MALNPTSVSTALKGVSGSTDIISAIRAVLSGSSLAGSALPEGFVGAFLQVASKLAPIAEAGETAVVAGAGAGIASEAAVTGALVASIETAGVAAVAIGLAYVFGRVIGAFSSGQGDDKPPELTDEQIVETLKKEFKESLSSPNSQAIANLGRVVSHAQAQIGQGSQALQTRRQAAQELRRRHEDFLAEGLETETRRTVDEPSDPHLRSLGQLSSSAINNVPEQYRTDVQIMFQTGTMPTVDHGFIQMLISNTQLHGGDTPNFLQRIGRMINFGGSEANDAFKNSSIAEKQAAARLVNSSLRVSAGDSSVEDVAIPSQQSLQESLSVFQEGRKVLQPRLTGTREASQLIKGLERAFNIFENRPKGSATSEEKTQIIKQIKHLRSAIESLPRQRARLLAPRLVSISRRGMKFFKRADAKKIKDEIKKPLTAGEPDGDGDGDPDDPSDPKKNRFEELRKKINKIRERTGRFGDPELKLDDGKEEKGDPDGDPDQPFVPEPVVPPSSPDAPVEGKLVLDDSKPELRPTFVTASAEPLEKSEEQLRNDVSEWVQFNFRAEDYTNPFNQMKDAKEKFRYTSGILVQEVPDIDFSLRGRSDIHLTSQVQKQPFHNTERNAGYLRKGGLRDTYSSSLFDAKHKDLPLWNDVVMTSGKQ